MMLRPGGPDEDDFMVFYAPMGQEIVSCLGYWWIKFMRLGRWLLRQVRTSN